MTQPGLSVPEKRLSHGFAMKLALFFAIAAIGLFYVKWNPYFHKAILAADNHDLGASFLGNAQNTLPEPSWTAAWSYSLAYFKSVWQAAVLGIVLGSLLQVLIPKDWLMRLLGRPSLSCTVAAGVAALPGMMCTCCAAPVAVGIRKRSGSVGAALAFWLGNPVLNPATLIFMFFVLGWKFALLRVIAGAVLVFGVSYWANRFVKENEVDCDRLSPTPGGGSSAAVSVGAGTDAPTAAAPSDDAFLPRWLKALWSLFWAIVPAYILAVLVLGAVRAWLFPSISPEIGGGLLLLIGMAVAGTLFVIPTAAEISIVKTMMSFGLGAGPAGALMMTLPAVSLPSLLMVRKAFPARVLWFVSSMVLVVGILTGLLAMAII